MYNFGVATALQPLPWWSLCRLCTHNLEKEEFDIETFNLLTNFKIWSKWQYSHLFAYWSGLAFTSASAYGHNYTDSMLSLGPRIDWFSGGNMRQGTSCYESVSRSWVWFRLAKFRPKLGLFRLVKKASTIQYGYRKWGTHARVFPQTLAHGNRKNEIIQRNRRRR